MNVAEENEIKVCAGIVLFNPAIDRLEKNIASIVDQVDTIVLIDNNSGNYKEIERLLSKVLLYEKITIIKNRDNYGVGVALNQIIDFANDNHYEWVITLDQDSVCNSKIASRYLEFINKHRELKIGQITCNITDEKLGEIEKSVFRNTDYTIIPNCITSGCINNVKAISEAGRFNEQFFIDGIDVEMSLRLRQIGYSIIKIDYYGLSHSLGDGHKKKLLFFYIPLKYHAPWRSYYMRRNFIYIARKYYKGIQRTKIISKQILISIGMIIFENNKIERLGIVLRELLMDLKCKIIRTIK